MCHMNFVLFFFSINESGNKEMNIATSQLLCVNERLLQRNLNNVKS